MKLCGVNLDLTAGLSYLFILISLLATGVVTGGCRSLGGGILEFC